MHVHRLELRDRKWVVEHHTKNKELVITPKSTQESIYVYACNDCVIHVRDCGGRHCQPAARSWCDCVHACYG